MTGYEKSPDYGGPEPSWAEIIFGLAMVAGIPVGIFILGFIFSK